MKNDVETLREDSRSDLKRLICEAVEDLGFLNLIAPYDLPGAASLASCKCSGSGRGFVAPLSRGGSIVALGGSSPSRLQRGHSLCGPTGTPDLETDFCLCSSSEIKGVVLYIF